MARDDHPERRLPALGQPPTATQTEQTATEADGDAAGTTAAARDVAETTEADRDADFASEHDKTAVAEDIITGADTDREPESPRGWSGMQR